MKLLKITGDGPSSSAYVAAQSDHDSVTSRPLVRRSTRNIRSGGTRSGRGSSHSRNCTRSIYTLRFQCYVPERILLRSSKRGSGHEAHLCFALTAVKPEQLSWSGNLLLETAGEHKSRLGWINRSELSNRIDCIAGHCFRCSVVSRLNLYRANAAISHNH
jgi:hypothetical protein